MPSETFDQSGQHSWTVPDRVDHVVIECWGAGGGDGNSAGDPGGYAKGELAVSPGETLYPHVGAAGNDGSADSAGGWPNGGDGGRATAGPTDERTSYAGGGGGSSDVRQGGTATGDIAILAGGGGGGGAADAGNEVSRTVGGAGGGSGETAADASTTNTTSGGGSGGGSGGFAANNGGAASDSGDTDGDTSIDTFAAAAGGGGGGGLNGGGGGGASAYVNFSGEASGAGGGGGDGDVSAVSASSMSTAGGNSGDGKVVITYTQKPTAPTDLTVEAARSTAIDLSWTDTSDNEGGFEIYRSTSAGVSTNDTRVADLPANTETYTDEGLSSQQTYYYIVVADNEGGTSDTSNEVSPTTPLPAPTLDAVTAATREATVEWTKEDASSDGEFEVYRSTDGSLGTLVADGLSPSTTSYTDTGLLDGEEYHYTVARDDGNGNRSYSATKSAQTPLPAPTDLAVTSVDGDQISLAWTDNANNGTYRVLVSDDGGSTWTTDGDNLGASATSYQTTNLLDGEQYTITVEVYTGHATTRDNA